MSQPNTVQAWVKFLTGLIDALENGQVAVDSLKDKTLPEMAVLSEEGWDKFDQALVDAKNTE